MGPRSVLRISAACKARGGGREENLPLTDCWREIDRAQTTNGDELILRHRGGVYEMRCNGWDLMSNRAHVSEEALARLGLQAVAAAAPRILIGGLGMGFTLRAALDAAPPGASITVAELLPEIIAWNKGALAALAGRPLDDLRAEVKVADVAKLLATNTASYNAILLDIDNGPDAIMYECNATLYARDGLRMARAALAPSGVLAVWSADRSSAFERSLSSAGFSWRAVDVPARSYSPSPLHVIYLAQDVEPE
jgi:spermidine synthase